jgi:hypothetical protein
MSLSFEYALRRREEYFTKPKKAVILVILEFESTGCHVLLVKDGRGGLCELTHDL